MDATDTFDPCSNANCGLGLTMVYDTILKLNYETMEVEPSIATSWEWVEDDLLKLTIRDDAVFSNGDPLTPEDVLYSLSRFVFENNQFDPGYDDIDYDNSYIEGNDLYLKLTTVSADLLLQPVQRPLGLCGQRGICQGQSRRLVERPLRHRSLCVR